MGDIDTHHAKVWFGKHQGQLLTRVPIGYLNWGVAVAADGPVELSDGRMVAFHEAARAEIQRRGERIQDMDISGHAIDRMSDRYISRWADLKKEGEGLYSFMQRVAKAAIDENAGAEPDERGIVQVNKHGLVWCIKVDQAVPTVITVKGGGYDD